MAVTRPITCLGFFFESFDLPDKQTNPFPEIEVGKMQLIKKLATCLGENIPDYHVEVPKTCNRFISKLSQFREWLPFV